MIDFFNEIINFIQVGLYDFVVETWAYIVIQLTIFKIKSQLAILAFSWDIAKEILIQLNISGSINTALSSLPSNVVQNLNFFNVINGLNLILNAFVTKYVMRFSGF